MNKTFLVAALAALAMVACKDRTTSTETVTTEQPEQITVDENTIASPVDGEGAPDLMTPVEPVAPDADGTVVAPDAAVEVPADVAVPADAVTETVTEVNKVEEVN